MKWQYLFWMLSAVTFVGILILGITEYRYFYFTIDWPNLVLKGMMAGLILSLLLTVVVWMKSKNVMNTLMSGLMVLLLSLFLCPFFAHWINRVMSNDALEMRKVEFWAEELVYDGWSGNDKPELSECRLFFFYKDRIQEVRYKDVRYGDMVRGNYIDMTMKKGLFGYEIIIL